MIAREGRIILIPTAILLLIGLFFEYINTSNLIWLNVYNYLLVLFLLFALYFFRNPYRIPIGELNEMVSPADGKIIKINEIDDPEIGIANKIAIFLSVFNVHSQYVPIDGKVVSTNYYPGKYLLAYNPKTSKENEQSVTLFTTNNNNFKVKQIAGLIARRILNYMEPKQPVIKGQRLGYIRFGSRVEIIVPKDNFKIYIKEGDRVKANISKIGIFNND